VVDSLGCRVLRYVSVTKCWSTKLSILAAILLCSIIAVGQEVEITPGKNSVALTITSSKSYHLLPTEEKQSTLTLMCALKGNKAGHLLLFSPGSEIGEDDPETEPRNGQLTLKLKIGGTKQVTSWIPYGSKATFAYYGKTEPERLEFIQDLLTSPTVSVQFKPYLTGQLVTSDFDLSQLRDEVAKHPECGLK